MSQTEIPPWLREQLTRLDNLQQNLQAVQMQKQQVEAELADAEKTLEELKTVPETEQIYKSVGAILVKVTKESISKELDEKKDISQTRSLVLVKQETRLKESVKELQAKIDDMLKSKSQGADRES
ncbi:MAG: prefoldin subunit beta [Thaumarchaeota archaeon]|nr:prefoldin subunit beta [Nitrososphaerota archaeon]